MSSLLVLLIIGAVTISASEVKKVVETRVSYGPDKGYGAGPKDFAYTSSILYHGKYSGHCGKDGFYYNDDASFVICSNGNAHIQPCAPGSKNSAYNHYQHGNSYYSRDFCDINLVDDGYSLKHGYTGNHGDGYGAPAGYGPSHPVSYGQEPYKSSGYNPGYGHDAGYRGNFGYGGHDGGIYGSAYQRTEYSGPSKAYGH